MQKMPILKTTAQSVILFYTYSPIERKLSPLTSEKLSYETFLACRFSILHFEKLLNNPIPQSPEQFHNRNDMN